MLNSKKTEEFINQTVKKSVDKFLEQPIFVLESISEGKKSSWQPNIFLSPILYSLNNSNSTPTVIADFPRLLHLNYLAKNLPLEFLNNLMEQSKLTFRKKEAFNKIIKTGFLELNDFRFSYLKTVLKECAVYDKIIAVFGEINRSGIR